jgi:hypothetical protein
LIGVPLDSRVRRVLGVDVDDGLAVTVDDDASAYFPAHVLAPQADNELLDGSPRTSRSPWRIYWERAPVEIGPSHRIEVPNDTTYELISPPRRINRGRQVVGFSAPAIPVAELYPRTAEVHSVGDDDVLATIQCNLYSPQEFSTARGSYEDAFAEAPPASWPDLEAANLELRFDGGEKWKVSQATLNRQVPYVNMQARRLG